jgi:predicted membrane-bound spermidine synthase
MTAAGAAPVKPIVLAVLIAAFLAGLASFIYEIAWIRMLSLVLGSSTHAFELMLSAFILGLAIGGYWIRRRISGYERPLRTLAVMFTLMAVLAALTLPAYGFAFEVMAGAMRMFNSTAPGYAGFNLVSHLIAAAMMLPTTIVAGMTLPLMTHYLLRTGLGEQAIGRVYAANTVGAIIGVLLAIHLLLPLAGLKGAVIVGAVCQLSIALLLFRREAPPQRSSLATVWIAASVALVGFLSITAKLDPSRMASGVYRYGIARVTSDSKVIFLRDGKTATITLTQNGTDIVIATNGKPDAGINMGPGAATSDEITMTMAAALPLAMHSEPKHIANIGVGSGLTSHVVLTSPVVQVLDSIEIEPTMVEAARIGFEARVKNFFHDPRSKIHYEDAKTFFAAANQKYDVIISEPSNPWVSGVASLFSGEFYAHVKRYLAPHGLLVQWVQIYETDITVVASIAKALSPNFADYAIYNTDNSNILIVASADGRVPTPRGDILQGALKEELHKVGIDTIGDIQVRRIASKRILDPLFNSYPVPRNSDYFPFVDLTAPRMRFLRRAAFALTQLHLDPIPITELLGEPGLMSGAMPSTNVRFYSRQDRVQEALAIRAALDSGDLSLLSPDQGKNVLAIKTSASICGQPGVAATWFQAVAATVTQTTPYLSGEDLRPVWRSIEASPCFSSASTADRVRLDFFKAVAMRDRDQVITRGSALLEEKVSLPAPARAEVLVAVAASMLGANRYEDAIKLLQADLALINARRDKDLGMRLVEAVAASHLPSGRDSTAGK